MRKSVKGLPKHSLRGIVKPIDVMWSPRISFVLRCHAKHPLTFDLAPFPTLSAKHFQKSGEEAPTILTLILHKHSHHGISTRHRLLSPETKRRSSCVPPCGTGNTCPVTKYPRIAMSLSSAIRI